VLFRSIQDDWWVFLLFLEALLCMLLHLISNGRSGIFHADSLERTTLRKMTGRVRWIFMHEPARKRGTGV